jgi:hypothetical protein
MDINAVAAPALAGATPTAAQASGPAINLRQKLAQVRREVGYIQKRGKNELHHYSYAMAADIAAAIGDRLAALNVVLGRRNLSVKRYESQCQQGQGAETVVEVTLDYAFIDGDSDEILSVPSYGEGRDSGDKAPYKALTGALKYALIQTFLLATGDDPEEERGETPGRREMRKSGPAPVDIEQARALYDLIEQTGTDLARVLQHYRVAKIEEMTASVARQATALLRRKMSKGLGRNDTNPRAAGHAAG